MNRGRGFTLIEVLVALAIVAIALVGVIKITGQSVRATEKVKEKLAAHWVAMNVIAGIQTGYINTDRLNTVNGSDKMLKLSWEWQAKLTRQPNGEIERVFVTVKSQASGHVVESLSGSL